MHRALILRLRCRRAQRIILANQPRVTRHEIAWDDDLTQEQRLLAEHQAAEAAQVRWDKKKQNVAMTCLCIFLSHTHTHGHSMYKSLFGPFFLLVTEFDSNCACYDHLFC